MAALHAKGIATFVMIAPMLPHAEGLVDMLKGTVDHVLIDKMNYHYADWVFKKQGIQWAMNDEFFQKGEELRARFERAGISCRKLF